MVIARSQRALLEVRQRLPPRGVERDPQQLQLRVRQLRRQQPLERRQRHHLNLHTNNYSSKVPTSSIKYYIVYIIEYYFNIVIQILVALLQQTSPVGRLYFPGRHIQCSTTQILYIRERTRNYVTHFFTHSLPLVTTLSICEDAILLLFPRSTLQMWF